jgi:Na+/H+-dicarboxylate symporter
VGVVYTFLLKVIGRLSPLKFFKKFNEVMLFAFSTASSNATIPVTLEVVEKRLGVKNSVASFTIPLGATVNMDGTAIMQGVATLFVAQAYGIQFGLKEYLLVIITATLASIGTAGVPGVGLVMLAMVFQQVGLPLEGIGLVMAVDRPLDMARTAVNVTGDGVVSCIVAKSEKQFDPEIYNSN